MIFPHSDLLATRAKLCRCYW